MPPYSQAPSSISTSGLSRAPCDDMEGQGYCLCSSPCFSCFSMVSVGLFWLCLFYLLGAVSNLLLHPVCEPSGTHSLFFVFWFGFPMELHTDISAVLIHVLSPFIWLFLLVFLCSSSHFLSVYANCKCITALCNRVYLPNSRDFPLSLYCLMAPDRAFLKGEDLNPVLFCDAGTPKLPEIHMAVITSKTLECRFIIEYVCIVIFTFKCLKAFVRWLIKHSAFDDQVLKPSRSANMGCFFS